jgi:hypothetical protein
VTPIDEGGEKGDHGGCGAPRRTRQGASSGIITTTTRAAMPRVRACSVIFNPYGLERIDTD